MKKTIFVTIITLLFITSVFSISEQTTTKKYRVPKVTGKIKPDGLLDEDTWKQALILEMKYEVQPGENIDAPVRTEVLLAYSETHLYVAFRAYDPEPTKIRARISDRDNTYSEDWVGVALDTFNDQRRAYDFVCNPFGIQAENIELTGGHGVEWDAIWDSGGRITEDGYFVEMSIPFGSLRFQRKNGDQLWGFDAFRSFPRKVTHKMGLFPRDRNNSCYLCQAVKLIGFNGVKQGKNLEFDPTLLALISREREDGIEGPFVKDKQFEPGITARWSFTSNLTLSGTVNPDFSHVEADSLQMDINEPFALFFSEKRPFFMEGRDFFSTPLNIVYTRMMRDPSWGVKLTGKEGANTIGAYMVQDTLTNLVFPGSEGSDSTSLSMNSTASVLRYRRDFGSNYTAGILFTNREGEDYYNRVLGFDGDFRFTTTDRVRMQLLGSTTQYPGEVSEAFGQQQGRFNDKAMDLYYSHDARNLDWYAGYRDMGRDFRSDLGFIPQVGYRSFYAGTNHTWYAKPDQWWTQFIMEGEYRQLTDQTGLLSRIFTGTLVYLGPLDIHSLFEWVLERERYNGVLFDQNRFFIHHCMNPNKDSHASFNIWFGDRIDYANTRLGKRIRLRPGITYNIGLHWRLSFSHDFERLWVKSERLYTANQTELRLGYQFNKRTLLRAVLQYVDYRYNVDNYIDEIDPVYKHFFVQALFSYKINPQTVLFLGYSDNYYGYQYTGMPLVNRTVFLKFGYALVL